jgi:hypothetical protein
MKAPSNRPYTDGATVGGTPCTIQTITGSSIDSNLSLLVYSCSPSLRFQCSSACFLPSYLAKILDNLLANLLVFSPTGSDVPAYGGDLEDLFKILNQFICSLQVDTCLGQLLFTAGLLIKLRVLAASGPSRSYLIS